MRGCGGLSTYIRRCSTCSLPDGRSGQSKEVSMKRYSLPAGAMLSLFFASMTMGADAVSKVMPYRIVDGRVDSSTYIGWQVYHQACHACHGVDATGTTLAPSLVERMRNLSAEAFELKVASSYRIIMSLEAATSDNPTARREALLAQIGRHEDPVLLMPAWDGDPKVRPHLSNLYAYLRARSDGALGPGKPQRISNHH